MKNQVGQFSTREIRDLIISIVVVSFVVAFDRKDMIQSVYLMPIMLVVVAPAFALHELGHKFAAQKYNYFAEYKMWGQGLLMAFVLKLLLGLTFIAPGAVYFSSQTGMVSREKVGKIGMAGPIVNLFLVVIFGAISLMSTNPLLQVISSMGAFVNAFLAAFNLIPFAPFDGQKIFAWDRRVWALMLVLAIASMKLLN